MKDEYPWESGDNFDLHFGQVEKGWTLERLIEHAGLPKDHPRCNTLAESLKAVTDHAPEELLLSYVIEPPPEGGFSHSCEIRIRKGIVRKVNIDSRHVSAAPR